MSKTDPLADLGASAKDKVLDEAMEELQNRTAGFGDDDDKDDVGTSAPETSVTISSVEFERMKLFLTQLGIDIAGLSTEELYAKHQKIKKIAATRSQVLSRGRTIDGLERLMSFVPKGYKATFVRDTPTDVARAEGLGWKVFQSKEASRESSTGKADGVVRLGDMLMMYTPEEDYAANQLAKLERNREKRQARERQRKTAPAQGGESAFAADPESPIKPVSQLGVGG